jgi:hypothetical protein
VQCSGSMVGCLATTPKTMKRIADLDGWFRMGWSPTVRLPKDRTDRGRVSFLVHEINNLICSIRLMREEVSAILTAIGRIEIQVARLRVLQERLPIQDRNRWSSSPSITPTSSQLQ